MRAHWASVRRYLEWGKGVVDKLNGMFAFGIWDVWNEELLLVRDRMGVRPLYTRSVSAARGSSSAAIGRSRPRSTRTPWRRPIETVRGLLDDTVSRQLISDVPLCSLLSGGLDSSAVTALAAKALAAQGGAPRTLRSSATWPSMSRASTRRSCSTATT